MRILAIVTLSLLASALLAEEPKTFREEFQAAKSAAGSKDHVAYLRHMQEAMKLDHDRGGRPFYQYSLARALALNGKTDEAIATLEQVWNERIEGPIISFAEFDPAFEKLRADPRYSKVRALFDSLAIEIRPAGGSVHEIVGPGCTLAASIGKDGILLVDSGYPGTGRALLRALAKQAGAAAHVRYVVNTHGHYDHAASNHEAGPEAIVIAHPAAAEEMKRGSEFFPGLKIPSVAEAALPDVMSDGALTIPFNGETVHVIAVSSHTKGDLVVWFESSRVLHMGDNYFGAETVRLPPGSDPLTFYAGLGALLAKIPDDTVVLSGHADRVPASKLKESFNASRVIFEFVRSAIAAGKSNDAIVAAGVEQGHPRAWVEFFLETLKKN